MRIEKSISEKTLICDLPHMDPIAVYTEDLGKSCGKLTITIWNEAWSYGWSGMGDKTIKEFVISCDNSYLFDKLCGRKNGREPDYVKFCNNLRKDVIRYRRDGLLNHIQARKCWNIITYLSDEEMSPEFLFNDHEFERLIKELGYDIIDVITDLPTKPSGDYIHFCKILDTIKEVFKGERDK